MGNAFEVCVGNFFFFLESLRNLKKKSKSVFML